MLMMPLCVWAERESFSSPDRFREFSDQQGRTFEARIVDVNERQGWVMLETKKGRRSRIKPDVLHESDQAYCENWNRCRRFLSSSGLRFSADKRVGKVWNESDDGIVNNRYEETYYECVLQNSAGIDLEQVIIQYCVYWGQETISDDEEVERVRSLDKEIQLDILKEREKYAFDTEIALLLCRTLDGGFYYAGGAPSTQNARMLGIWIRVYFFSGESMVAWREFCHPKRLIEKREWLGAGRPKEYRKKGRRENDE